MKIILIRKLIISLSSSFFELINNDNILTSMINYRHIYLKNRKKYCEAIRFMLRADIDVHVIVSN